MIIISGASRGIGKYLLERYVSGNVPVIGIFRSSSPKPEMEGFFRKADVTDFDQVQSLIVDLNSILKDITLINCAGITYNSFTHKSDPEKWKEVVNVNLFGTYNLIRVLLPIMREQRFGRIINLGSVVAQRPSAGISSYSASKAALWGLTKSVAVENASLNITINTLNLGYTDGGMISEVPEKFLSSVIDQIPGGKLLPMEEIYNLIETIRITPYINGSSIDINGALI
jgi:NAD(P)-dependent dehydrogenase (short-subunit alcohol dehydrogenase family)